MEFLVFKKSFLFITLTSLLLPTTPLRSEFEDDILSQEKMTTPSDKPIRLVGNFDNVAKTNIDKKHFTDQSVKFYSIAGEAGAIVCYSKVNREAFFVAGGYSTQKIEWKENPYFSQDIFDTASLALKFYSNRLADWIWQAQVAINGDIEHFDWGRYTNYDLTLWGRYKCSENLGFHAGFYMQTGMRLDRIYPIIGFDWTINKTWKLNAVFPMDISLEYTYDCNWTAAVAMRFFDVRHRTGENEPLPRALVSYRNNGTEASLTYTYESFIEANVHAGWTFAGKLRISDKHNHHPKHFKLDPAGYFGGEVIVKF